MNDTIKANMYADNWFILYINGELVAVDSIDSSRTTSCRSTSCRHIR